MRETLIAMVALLAGSPSLALAATDCSNPQDQATMTECAGRDLKEANAKLNAQYKEIEKRLADSADAKKLLVSSQRAWVAFRDAECSFQASGAAGGTIYGTIYANCVTALTTARSKDFDGYLKCQEGDLSCPVPAGD
ncbi:lysozyme inhibitor LprI family protein [Labrys okinawensis]|uniref:lysozyme inhibitor LprI family protein n=1 Tax=Labrys okinawensis TaxID=346911 RepID=UPI0039BCF3C1